MTTQHEQEGWEKEFYEDIELWKQEAGEIPDNTCPGIDKCINQIEEYEKEVEYIRKICHQYDGVESMANDLPTYGVSHPTTVIDNKLRSENEQLRYLGRFWYEKCFEMRNRIDSILQSNNDALVAEVEGMKRNECDDLRIYGTCSHFHGHDDTFNEALDHVVNIIYFFTRILLKYTFCRCRRKVR